METLGQIIPGQEEAPNQDKVEPSTNTEAQSPQEEGNPPRKSNRIKERARLQVPTAMGLITMSALLSRTKGTPTILTDITDRQWANAKVSTTTAPTSNRYHYSKTSFRKKQIRFSHSDTCSVPGHHSRRQRWQSSRLLRMGLSHSVCTDTILAVDWSKHGVGFMLLQTTCKCEAVDNHSCCATGWVLILAGGRFTHPSESRYSLLKGEALAVVEGLEGTKDHILRG